MAKRREISQRFLIATVRRAACALPARAEEKKDLPVSVLRNGEWFFHGEFFTNAACKDTDGKIHEFAPLEISHRDQAKNPAHPDDPWLAFYNPENGRGFATVRLDVRNTGPDGKEPTLAKYHMLVVYWNSNIEISRYLVEAEKKETVQVEAGNVYREREVVFTFDARKDAVKLMDRTAERLRHPLEVERLASSR